MYFKYRNYKSYCHIPRSHKHHLNKCKLCQFTYLHIVAQSSGEAKLTWNKKEGTQLQQMKLILMTRMQISRQGIKSQEFSSRYGALGKAQTHMAVLCDSAQLFGSRVYNKQ